MVQHDEKANSYQCEECGLHYASRETAERCEAWCREHKSCNLEIIREALENAPADNFGVS